MFPLQVAVKISIAATNHKLLTQTVRTWVGALDAGGCNGGARRRLGRGGRPGIQAPWAGTIGDGPQGALSWLIGYPRRVLLR